MNRLDPSPTCRICGTDVGARLRGTELVLLRAEFARMIVNGMCDDCQRERFEAAQEYESALAEIRMLLHLGADQLTRKSAPLFRALQYARRRRRQAEAACVRLKMWPASAPVREGKK